MRKLIWVCDKCGFEKRDPGEDSDPSVVFSGWVIMHKYTDGVCETIDLCPECAEELFNN